MEPLDQGLDLELIRTFIAVAEEGSLSRATTRLFRTQSAVSRRIQALEQLVQGSLFVRKKGGMALTALGESLILPARQMLSAHGAFLGTVRDGPSGEPGSLKIACSDTVARYLLAPGLAQILSKFPNLKLELLVSNTPQTIQRVSHCEVDIGFVLLPAHHQGIEFRPIQRYFHMAAFPAGFAPRGKEITLAKLLEHPLVLLDRTTRTRQLIDASLLSKGMFPGRITEVGNVSVQKALVRAGLGVGILPEYAKEAGDGLAWRSIQGASERILAACLRKAGDAPSAVQQLLDSLRR